MKNSIKKLFTMLAIGMSFVAVQSVCAETLAGTLEGTIDAITIRPPTITVDDTVVSAVKYNYLCNQYSICLDVGDWVSVDYYEWVCPDGTIVLKACKITAIIDEDGNKASVELLTCTDD
jgi:hypothetical protein